SDFRGRIRGRCVSYFTLRACPKNDGLAMLRYGEGPVTLLPTDEPSDHRGAANGVGTPVTIGRLAPAVTDHDRDPPPLSPTGAAQSMRASAQVTAPGAVTNIIVTVSTRPNRQNRSTCSRMSVPWFEVARADCTAESIEM